MNGPSKVISFEKLQSRQQARVSPNKVFVEARSIFVAGMDERVARLFAKADDELFRLSEKADNSVLQAHYFSHMRLLRLQRVALQADYLRKLTALYEAFWRHSPLPDWGQKSARSVGGELSLLANDILEEAIAINGMVEKGNDFFRKDLYALDQRFMALLGKPGGKIEINPVSPQAICRLFAATLAGLNLDLSIKILIYKLYDRHVLSCFGAVYHDLNAHMAEAGICPAIAKTDPLRRSRAEHGAGAPSARRAPRDGQHAKAYLETFETLRGLLDTWLGAQAKHAPPSGPRPSASVASHTEILSILGLLQRTVPASQGKTLSGEEMKRLLAGQIARFHAHGNAPQLDRQVEDIIDLVGMIFVCILEDGHLTAPVKAILANLQIPVLKIAILDKTFFAKKNHPARLLLNSLAQAGMGLEHGAEADNSVYQKIAAVVERIRLDLDRDAELFSGLLEDFAAFMAVEHRRNRAAEERTRQTTQSKVRVRQAKRAVAYVLASRLSGVALPAFLKSFLCGTWKEVLVLSWLRRKKDLENWNSAIALMDQLIGLANAPALPQAVRRPEQGAVLAAMQTRLEILGYEQHWLAELFKDLGRCLSKHDHNPPEDGAGEWLLLDVTINDPEFAGMICEIERTLPEGNRLLECGPDLLGVAGGGASKPAQAASARGDEDLYAAKAASLSVGQWVEFTEKPVSLRRAKLSWKNCENDVYVFVNAKGAKVMEMRLADLAGRLRSGAALVIEDSGIPLMDRALSKLMRTLENPPAATPSR